jgi:hypothetical protein
MCALLRCETSYACAELPSVERSYSLTLQPHSNESPLATGTALSLVVYCINKGAAALYAGGFY